MSLYRVRASVPQPLVFAHAFAEGATVSSQAWQRNRRDQQAIGAVIPTIVVLVRRTSRILSTKGLLLSHCTKPICPRMSRIVMATAATYDWSVGRGVECQSSNVYLCWGRRNYLSAAAAQK